MSSMRSEPTERFLSREACIELAKRVASFAVRGGRTTTDIESVWRGNIRWARNQVISSGDVQDNRVGITRVIRGANNRVSTNQISTTKLEAAVRRAERLLLQKAEALEAPLADHYLEPYKEPKLWFDSSYKLEADARAETMRTLVKPAEEAGLLAAGYIEVSAHGRAVMNTQDQTWYYPFTRAQYSVTVRDPQGTASGWAGVDWNDWERVNAEKISAIALDKCLRSRNPVAVEPGRYTTVLEPQAVADFVSILTANPLDREYAEDGMFRGPFSSSDRGMSRIGESLLDQRVTMSVDYMHPDLGFPPFDIDGNVFNPVEWIKNGVLKELAYPRNPYGIRILAKNSGLPNSGAYMMSGGTSTVEDMVSTTKRGILVTRFSGIALVSYTQAMITGVTRDGTWLIENGKITKAIKNLRFTESPMFALNNLLEMGPPQRVFSPERPTVVPPLKIQDFSFTSLSDAV